MEASKYDDETQRMPDDDGAELEASAVEEVTGRVQLFNQVFQDLGEIVNKFNGNVSELESTIGNMELELEYLDNRINSKKKNFRKRMGSALDMSEKLSKKIRKIVDCSEEENDEEAEVDNVDRHPSVYVNEEEQRNDAAEAEDESKDEDAAHTVSLASEYEDFVEYGGNVEYSELGEEYGMD